MNFSNIQAARDYLLGNGYRFFGFGAMTKAEGWKKDGKALFIRRAQKGWSVR